MFKTSLIVEITDQACVGCTLCVKVCPSGALSMQDRLAVLEPHKCVGCLKCVEQCIPYGAIAFTPDPSPREMGIPPEEWPEPATSELCAEARLDPDQIICVCTGTTAAEVAAGIVMGIHEPEDLALATGVRALCGWLCVSPVLRLLQVHGVTLGRSRKDYRIYEDGLDVAIWNIPPGVDEKYPEYRLSESLEAIEAGTMNEPTPWMPDILPSQEGAR